MNKQFFSYNQKKIFRYFRTRRTAKLITAALFLLLFAGVATAVFLFFKNGLLFIQKDPYFQPALLMHVYEMYFLMIMALMLTGNIIVSLFRLFKRENDGWIMASPGYCTLPGYNLVLILLSSSWSFFVLALPGLLAATMVFQISIWNCLAVVVAMMLLIGLTSLLSAVIVLILGKVLYEIHCRIRLNVLTVKGLSASLVVFLVFSIWMLWKRIWSLSFIKVLEVSDTDSSTRALFMVIKQFSFSPSHLVAGSLFSAQNGDTFAVMRYVVVLLALTVVLFLLFKIAVSWYLPLWQVLQEGSFEASTEKIGHTGRALRFPRFFHNPIGALFEKEGIMMVRSVRNLMWLGFSVFLWFIYTALNVVLAEHTGDYTGDYQLITRLIPAMQFITVVYFVSTLVLRFVFPAFSQERKTAWIIISAPIDLKKIFAAKALFFCFLFTLIGLLIGGINLFILGIPVTAKWVMFALFVIAVITVTILGLSMGALFPNFETDDPEYLSTSLPGLVFVAGSLLYGAFGTYVLYGYFLHGSLVFVGIFIASSLGLTGLISYVASRSLGNMDFIKTNE